MIISHILGGIGNQMFQYAAGRALSLKTSQSHLVDLNDFTSYRLHQGFELDRVFNLDVQKADIQTIQKILTWRAYSLPKKILRRPQFAWLRGKQFVVEPYFNYWSGFTHLSGDCYLYGYWQSEYYFKTIETIIRKDFTFRETLSGKNAELASEILGMQAVSLHVRRGDYVSDSKNHNIMEVCSIEYYKKAIDYIAERVERPVFLVFSDDIAWVKQNLPVKFPCIYVDNNRGAESYRDMQLMSLCKHHVIANSSFSWWGAWLNADVNKVVVAPQSWFRDGKDDRDLIPKEWVRL